MPRFITMFTTAHMSLFLTRLILSMSSHPIPWKSILTLTSPPCLGLPNYLFPSGFPIKILCVFIFCLVHATCPIYNLLNLISQYYFMRCTNREALHYAIFSVLYYFLPFRSEYSSDPIPNHPDAMFFPPYEGKIFTPI